MRGPGVVFVLCAALASSVAVLACSLAVDSSGLAGTAPAATEGGLTESGVPTDGEAPKDGALPDADAAAACDAGVMITSFAGSGWTTEGNVIIDGNKLVATGTTAAKDQEINAIAVREITPVPSSMHLTYDITVSPNTIVYTEPGCGVYLVRADGETLLRQTLYVNQASFGQYLNVTKPGGSTDNRETTFFDLAPGPSTHHVDITLAVALSTTTTTESIAVTIDGKAPKMDSDVLPDPVTQLVLRCGIPYGTQVSPGSTTTTVTISNLSVSTCL
jgi:hypothetical protein